MTIHAVEKETKLQLFLTDTPRKKGWKGIEKKENILIFSPPCEFHVSIRRHGGFRKKGEKKVFIVDFFSFPFLSLIPVQTHKNRSGDRRQSVGVPFRGLRRVV